MLKNYLKVTVRNLIHHKLYSIISIIGLGLGIACCLLIFLYVQDELSFDAFHTGANRIYRVLQLEEGTTQGFSATPHLLAGELRSNFPEVEAAVRFDNTQNTVKYQNISFSESIALTDPEFFTVFSFPLIHGNPHSVLSDPSFVVLTSEMVEKYFPNENPIGKPISILLGDAFMDFTVSGVIDEAPSNSSIQYSLIISIEHSKQLYPERLLDSWNIILSSTFLQLIPGTSVPEFETKLDDFCDRMFVQQELGSPRKLGLQPLTDIHLNPDFGGISVPAANPIYSYILSAIAMAVLLIACINFMSLAVGRSSGRAREVGLRKVLGAQRSQLMRQFWGESLILSIAALILGIVLVEVFLPTFNNLAEKELTFSLFSNQLLSPALIVLTCLTAFVAGIYPALLLSRLMPVDTFRGNTKFSGKNRLIQALVVLQFAISIFLIACTFIIASQINYIHSQKLGYNEDFVITVPTQTDGEEAANLVTRLRHEMTNHPDVIDVAGHAYPFGDSWLYIGYTQGEGTTVLIGEDITSPGYPDQIEGPEGFYYMNWVDEHFIPAMEMHIIKGRNFSEEFPSDKSGAVVINQTAAKMFGWDDPIGQRLPGGISEASVIGVVEDFHFYPLHRKIEPLVLHIARNNFISSYSQIAIRINTDDMSSTLTMLENVWSDVSNGMPFEYRFLDDRIAEQYGTELRWRSIVQYSSVFTFLVACLGLFGLTSLAVAKRTREVGIRKVLGASIAGIVTMFSTDFAKLVLIANIIAWPIAYIVMNRWLSDFAYRTNPGITTFLLTGIIALVIAVLTVSVQAIKAAITNPVDSLRYE